MNDIARHETAKTLLAHIEDYETEYDIRKDPSLLFSTSMKINLARLQQASHTHYIKLMERWKRDGVKRLTELGRAIDSLIRDHKKRAALSPLENADGFFCEPSGKIKNSPQNMTHAISKLGVTLSYNVFSGKYIIEGLPGFGPELTDAALDRLYLKIEEEYSFLPTYALFQTVALDYCRQRPFHPVKEYLDWQKVVWDGVPRIDTWLSQYAGVEDTPYARAVGAIFMIAAVRRIMHPGCKFDEMLTLESDKQGIMKSTLLAELAVNREWFTDSVSLSADDKVVIEQTAGKWIVEASELGGMRKAEVEKVRAQLSRTTDSARPAYGKTNVDRPRQFVFAGTTNGSKNSTYLNDPAGFRRIWPVEATKCDIEAIIRDRDLLWGEACYRESKGESIRLPEHLWQAAGLEQAARTTPNPFTDVLGSHLDGFEGAIPAGYIWQLLDIPVERQTSSGGKMGAAMKELGWERKQMRVCGRNTWHYVKGSSGRILTVEKDGNGPGKFYVVFQRQTGSEDDDYGY
jgi:hypothetical protein